MPAFVRRYPLVCGQPIKSHLELVEGLRDIRDQPREDHAIDLDALPKLVLDKMLDCPQLLLPNLNCVLHHAVRFGGANRRLDRNGLPHAFSSHCPLEGHDTGLLVGLECELLPLVP